MATKLGMLWNVTPYGTGMTASRTTLGAESDIRVADGRGYLVEAPDVETARRMVREHYFQSGGWEPTLPLIWVKRDKTRPIMRQGI